MGLEEEVAQPLRPGLRAEGEVIAVQPALGRHERAEGDPDDEYGQQRHAGSRHTRAV